MSADERKLTFCADGLAQQITLLLIFDPSDAGKPFSDFFLTCWKVITLMRGEHSEAKVTYTGITAFASPQIDSGNLVNAYSSALCDTDKKCSIVDDNVVTPAVSGEAGYLMCTNETVAPTDIALGFASDWQGADVEPALVWTKVAVNSRVRTQFTPFMEIYATNDYQETEILRGAVESPLLWKRNLQTLRRQTNMNVSVDRNTGEIIIAEA